MELVGCAPDVAAASLHRPGATATHRLAARQAWTADISATPARRAGRCADAHGVEGDAAQAAVVVRGHRQPGQDRPAHRDRHARARHQRPGHPISGGVGGEGRA